MFTRTVRRSPAHSVRSPGSRMAGREKGQRSAAQGEGLATDGKQPAVPRQQGVRVTALVLDRGPVQRCPRRVAPCPVERVAPHRGPVEHPHFFALVQAHHPAQGEEDQGRGSGALSAPSRGVTRQVVVREGPCRETGKRGGVEPPPGRGGRRPPPMGTSRSGGPGLRADVDRCDRSARPPPGAPGCTARPAERARGSVADEPEAMQRLPEPRLVSRPSPPEPARLG